MAIAHNVRAYNTYFIYEYCIEKSITSRPIFQWIKDNVHVNEWKYQQLTVQIVEKFVATPSSNKPQCYSLRELRKSFSNNSSLSLKTNRACFRHFWMLAILTLKTCLWESDMNFLLGMINTTTSG